MLNFNPQWRFKPLPDGRYKMTEIPAAALWEFEKLIGKIATQGVRWDLLEHFKGAFSNAAGSSHVCSSSEDWAQTDLDSTIRFASANAPLFLEAFQDACEALARKGLHVPDFSIINDICLRHEIGYVLRPPDLLVRESAQTHSVAVSARPATVTESAIELLHQSLARSEELLVEGHDREAVQESLWVLESLATAFRDVESAGDVVRGKYFNDIVNDLRRVAKGSTLEQVLKWIGGLHGYLSSPTGGGVRHGLDLNVGVPVGPTEARLFCNLIRSYVMYLLSEHERLLTLR